MKFLSSILPSLIFLSLISCNQNKLKERELSIRERELAIKEKELGINSKDSNSAGNSPINESESGLQSMKEITNSALKHFSVYKTKLEQKNTAIGLSDTYTGDFTGDGKEDVVIYYSIEPTDGGNYLAGQGLVLYKNTGTDAAFICKYEPKYLFSFGKVSNGNIYISKDEYKDDDPHCCPSIHTIMELRVNDNKVTEHKK